MEISYSMKYVMMRAQAEAKNISGDGQGVEYLFLGLLKLAEIKAIKDEMCVFQKKVALLNTKAEKCESFYYKLSGSLDNCARLEGMDYKKLSIIERTKLGTLINNVHSLSVVVKESI